MEFLLLLLGLAGIGGAVGGGSSGGSGPRFPEPEIDPVAVSAREAAFESFVDSGAFRNVTSTDINGTEYNLRNTEPDHRDFKFKDPDGNWWSPDYFVVVTAGQSNMLGSGTGGDLTIDPNLMVLNPETDELEEALYGEKLRNNLQIPFSNRAIAELEQPVLLVSSPVAGSKIDSWLTDGEFENPGYIRPLLNEDVTAALNAVDQTQVDAFLWLQGESDWYQSTETYAQKVQDLIDQTRSEDWASEDLPFLIGELSREGINQTQNAALQLLELTENDPNLVFVSSVGLTSHELSGVHYDGVSLVELGYERFWNSYEDILAERANPGSTASNNEAPILVEPTNAANTPPEAIYLRAGDVLEFDITPYFTDPDGDELYYYASITERGKFFYEPDDGKIILDPTTDDTGIFELNIYAADYHLDGQSAAIELVVFESDLDGDRPYTFSFKDRNFEKLLETNTDFEAAAANLETGNGIEILGQEALSATEEVLIETDNLFIRADGPITGAFEMATDVATLHLEGSAEFNVKGHDGVNRIYGNDAANRIESLGGNDRVYGGDGDDMLFGGAGNDILYGDGGDDYVNTGTGSDQAFGGEGADKFAFGKGMTSLQLRDFDHAGEGDTVEVSGFDGVESGENFLAAITLKVNESADRLELSIEDERLYLYGIEEEELDASFFVVV